MTDLVAADAPVVTAAPTIAVVVCCYTTRRWTQIVDAIASIRAQTLSAEEIILVVDHAPDLLAQAAQFNGVRVIPNVAERGLSGARNTGVAASHSAVIAFLDDDAVADPDWLEQLAATYDDPAVLGVGGHVEPAWEGDRPSWFPPEFDWVVGCSHPGQPREGGAVRNFIGANMSFRRDVLDRTGGFRPDLGRIGRRPVGCEETELCIRASKDFPGGILLHQPTARVRHQVPSERQTWAYFRSRCFGEGLSKAVVARIAGRQSALASERDYVRRVLPRGMIAGGRRAVTIASGLAVTAAGYAVGRAMSQRRTAFYALPVLAALVTWAVSLRSVGLDSMTDLGLVSVLPIAFWIALAVVIGTAVVAIHHGRGAGPQFVALILMMHGTPALLYGTLRYSWAWKHLGIVDYIVRNGAVDPDIPTLNAYHAWPGFFALNAELSTATGVATMSYAGWAPVVNTLLVLVPLWLIFDTLTGDRRRVWFALLVFLLANWIGQEYFSPQAFAYLLHLTVLAICLRWLPGRASGHRRRALVAVIALLMLAIVSSHQLTPFMLLTALTALVVTRRVRPFWLPLLLASLTVLWIYTMAAQFLGQNLYWIVESIGRPASNTQTTFVDLSQAGEEQHLVAWADRGLTAGMWLLGLAGALRLWRARAPYRITALLAVSPLPLLAANSYGGEMLFRVYLFALPFLALLVAGLFYPRSTTGRGMLPAAIIFVLVMATAFSLAYYGKERANRFTPDEVAASTWLYGHAPRGAVVLSATANYPWAFTHYEYYRYEFLENLPPAKLPQLRSDPDRVLTELGGTTEPIYVVLTRSEQVSVRYTGVLPAGAWARITTDLAKDPDYRLAYSNDDAMIYVHAAKAHR